MILPKLDEVSTDEFKIPQLPSSSEDAFIVFERYVRTRYEAEKHREKEIVGNFDLNGFYCGEYWPEKSYVNAILAYVDEYNLGLDLPDVLGAGSSQFNENFQAFKSKVDYIVIRFSLRKVRVETGAAGTIVTIASTYKQEIGSLLERIRKIVNQEISDPNKKDKIFIKIAKLQSEVDRDKTTYDAMCVNIVNLSRALGESAEKIKPVVDLIERIKKIFWEHANEIDLLPRREQQKLITQKTGPSSTEDDTPL